MRRFFSRNKDSSSSNNNNSENKDNKQAVLHGQKASSRLIAQKDVFVDKPAAAVVEASPTAKQDIPSSNTARAEQGPPTTPAKQVAFAVKTLPATPESLLRTPEHRDAYSHVSFHGRSSENVARSPAALSCFPNSNMMGNRSTSNPLYTTQHLSPIVPSQPIRHVSLDVPSAAREKDRDATLRASQTATSPARGEIPRFQGPTTPTTGQHQQRSGTSMSHDTSVSTTSSLADARQAFYGSNNNSSSADKMYYPNLAVLATYSRDMSAMNGTNGQHSIMQHLTWSEITDEQLVENLGGRERTRQEVLFEMVCSEERYVQELIVCLMRQGLLYMLSCTNISDNTL